MVYLYIKEIMKVDILAIGVHPDDIELGCGGTLIKHIEQWYTVWLCDLTQGELGTRWSKELRIQEAQEAQKILWAVCRENLEMRDWYFQHDEENINKIIHIIRKYQPEIVFANAVQDRHPDHGRAAKLIADACFYSWLIKIETGQVARRPKVVYHYIQDQSLKADFAVDISTQVDTKKQAILAYKSQFHDPTSKEPETPISWETFVDSVLAKNAMYGRPIWAAYAEWFTINRTIGVKNIFDLM